MSNIAIRKNGGEVNRPAQASAQAPAQVWDPSQMIRNFFGWDPFREMVPSLFEVERTFAPAFEVKENPEGYLFKADLPGIKEQDIAIQLSGNRLNITGKREAEKREQNETYYCYERTYGSFARSFTLPPGCDGDHVKAELRDGVLTVAVPKKAEALPKKVAIKTAESTKS